ncbi:MAG: 9-O-acetylesterase, partial [Gemmatimonadaceae bacterium]|nr:9-O-acetylesterase [Gemmatimonadaceae bacterium]
MKRRRLFFSLLALPLVLAMHGASAQSGAHTLQLARIFSDGMVVQRGARIPVWGWAAPGAAVTARFKGTVAHATADSSGRWTVTFPASAAGGPYRLTVDAGSEHASVGDVLVGDVWVASGQSNMEFSLSVANDAAAEIAAAHDSSIREFKVPNSWAERPATEDVVGGSWAPADPQHVGAFSAVAYFFARELRRTQHVP